MKEYYYPYRFYEDFNFPGVVGCVDCTHIAIFPPKIDDEENPEHIYVNRKGYHSINVQLVSSKFSMILLNDCFLISRYVTAA